MIIRNPCRKCLVKAACKVGCENYKQFHNDKYFIIGRTIDAILATAFVTFFATLIGIL